MMHNHRGLLAILQAFRQFFARKVGVQNGVY